MLGQESKVLILDKVGSKHRITYYVGDNIILKLKGEDYEIKDEISDIKDSVLVLSNFFIPVNSIHYVKTIHTKGFLSPSNGPKIMIAGATLFIFDILNQTVVQGGTYKIDTGVTIVAASLIGFGGLLMTFKYRKFKPGKNKRIRTFVM
jgi:hypothetical protein